MGRQLMTETAQGQVLFRQGDQPSEMVLEMYHVSAIMQTRFRAKRQKT
jgi:hypothetical protein